jgi:hypothetical protein
MAWLCYLKFKDTFSKIMKNGPTINLKGVIKMVGEFLTPVEALVLFKFNNKP